jgi:superfamily II DNA or RNA helicase
MADELLTEVYLVKLAGWDAVKEARQMVAGGRVLSADYQPPLLKGLVRSGEITYQAGLVCKNPSDADNICTCRAARQWGTICAHSVAVGLQWLQQRAASVAPKAAPAPAAPAQPTAVKRLRRAAPGEGGEPLELFVLFPPNVAQAVEKGRVTLCFEARWAKGRAPLNTLPLDQPFAVGPEDAALLEHLENLAGSGPPAMAVLPAAQLADLLATLAGHPRVTMGRSQPLTVSAEPLRLAVQASLRDNGEITLRLGGEARPALVRGATTWAFHGTQFQPTAIPASVAAIFEGPVTLPRSRVPQFLSMDWPGLVARCDVTADFDLEDFSLEPASPRFKLHLAGGLAILTAKLECFYGTRSVKPGVSSPEDALWLPDPAAPTRYSTRNLAAEQAAVARLTRHGFIGPDSQGCWIVKGQDQVLGFFAREFPRMEKEWEVTLEERLERSTEQNLERVEPRFVVSPSGEQWFDLSVSYESSGGERLSAAEVQRLLLSGRGVGRSRSGKFLLLDSGAVEELQEVLLDASPQQQDGAYRLDNAQAGFVDATLRRQGWSPQAPQAWAERAALQRGELKPPLPPLGGLEAVLRPYQKEGVAWLHFLRANGFGGVLADEMGLGKTLQVLALLAAVRNARHETRAQQEGAGPRSAFRAPSLVVCPTSLVFNWVAEARRFTPELRVLAIEGPERGESFVRLPDHDLIVTSYALLRRDFERYRAVAFDTVVLDEAQHIKNRQTQNAQAVKALRSRHRLVLTGTPMENSVLDLWSVFDFLMPGYLGSAKDFRERYELPITKAKDPAATDRLARRVRPFLLRRLKREVAADLPAKVEQVAYCELTEEQRAVYQQLLEAGRREVTLAVEANGLAKSRMVVLTTLLRLRQVCCDLRLLRAEQGEGVAESGSGPEEALSPLPDESPVPAPSGKLDLFSELLDEVIDGGHRALVFSQFTRMLGLLREQLGAAGVECCYLDGTTVDRAAVVERFQRDSRIPVFLISLKAGGTGLNLTGADTVIHFDPWWNPAVEAQATDRAHRIGQRRVVTSYKLITRGTVEEKILSLQQRKQSLLQTMLGGEEQFVGALNWEEIQQLLSA